MQKYNWTENDIKIIKENHGKKTLRQIMALLNIPNLNYFGFRSKCQTLGLYRDRINDSLPFKNTFNLEYWKNPNLSNCAMAGRLASDGCIFINKNNSYVFAYKCSIKDECVIDEIIKEFNFSGKKNYSNGVSPSYDDRITSFVDIKMIPFDKNAEYLKKYFNIIPNKTFRLGPTNLNDDVLNLAFSIGLIDGDGTIAIGLNKKTKRKNLYIHFCSCSKAIVEWYKELMDRKFPYYFHNRVAMVGKQDNLYRFSINGLRAAIIVDYLRQFPIWKLSRKWNNPEVLQKIEEYKQKYPQYFNYEKPDFSKYL